MTKPPGWVSKRERDRARGPSRAERILTWSIWWGAVALTIWILLR